LLETHVIQFISESLQLGKQWRKIGLLGGEPTLNPHLNGILSLLGYYQQLHLETNIWMMTNGTNKQVVNRIIKKFPWLTVLTNTDHSYHHAFYVSPTDEGLLGSNTRCEALHCGVGLGPYGFTPCVLGTTMHRIFGYETIKSLKDITYNRCMSMFPEYCQHCGWYLVDSDCREEGRIWSYDRGYMSESWNEMYKLKGDK
jgi:hypothetical protein